jgi:cysteine-rich repeat protein
MQVDLWNTSTGFGIGVACGTSIDTGLNIRDQFGAVLTSNDDRSGAADRCSGITITLAAGATVYAHVVEYGDDATIAHYAIQLRLTPIVCGDGTQTAVYEECDDGNTANGDGCSATCQVEGSLELEPNEDGTPSTGGTGIAGNDFDVGGSVAVTNSTAQGVTNVSTTNRTWRAALTPVGDEDVFAFTNPSGAPVDVQFDTYDLSLGINRACTGVDTGINVRNAAGTVLASNDNRVSGDNCSRVIVTIAAGATVYIHVTEFGDNNAIARYALVSRRLICGDGSLGSTEECDDANTTNGDGCSSSCQLEAYINEVEPNDTTAQADAAAIQLTGALARIRGAIAATTDVDFYKLTLATNSTVRMETFTVRPNTCDATTTTLRIMNSAGVEITNDNAGSTNASGIAACAAMVIPLAAGTYYVKVEETGVNAVIAKYFLEVVATTDTSSEMEPNDTTAQANGNLTLVSEAFCSGDHSVLTDVDLYRVTVPAGKGLRAEIVEGDRAVETCEGNGVDSRLTLYAPNGTTQLVDDDDDGRGFCSAIDGTGNTPRDAAAFNNTAAPVIWFLQVRASSFASGADGQFIYKLNVTIR